MIIQCNKIISSVSYEDLGDESPFLIKGKEYAVFAMQFANFCGWRVYIQTENFNEPSFMNLDGFEIVSQKIPSSWVVDQKIVGRGPVVTMLPASWNYNDFFEELSEELPSAVDLYHQEVRKIYQEEGLLGGDQ